MSGVISALMSKGKRISGALLLLGLAAFLCYWLWLSKKPSYNGKSVDAWLNDFTEPEYFQRQSQARMQAALAAMGPSAAPYVVRKIRLSDSSVHRKYRNMYPKLPIWLAKLLPHPQRDFPGRGRGVVAFFWLGPGCEPQLVALLEDRSPTVRDVAAVALDWLYRESKTDIQNAIGPLTRGLQDADAGVRQSCANTLGSIGTNACSAVAALEVCLHDSDSGGNRPFTYAVRRAAARALGQIGPGAKDALPALRTLFLDRDPDIRMSAAVALWRIDSDVTNTLPILIDGLNKVSPNNAIEAVDSLAQMGPRAKDAVPGLLQCWQATQQSGNTNSIFAKRTTNALTKIDPEAARTLTPKN